MSPRLHASVPTSSVHSSVQPPMLHLSLPLSLPPSRSPTVSLTSSWTGFNRRRAFYCTHSSMPPTRSRSSGPHPSPSTWRLSITHPQSFIDLLTHSPTHSPAHPLSRSHSIRPHTRTQSLICPPSASTHPRTHSPTHQSTRPPFFFALHVGLPALSAGFFNPEPPISGDISWRRSFASALQAQCRA